MNNPKIFIRLLILVFLLFSCQNQKETREEIIERVKKNENVAEPILVALEEYHITHGSYPDDLNDLIPNFLLEIPKTVTGQEFHYYLDEFNNYYLCFGLSEPFPSGCCYHGRLEVWDCSGGH